MFSLQEKTLTWSFSLSVISTSFDCGNCDFFIDHTIKCCKDRSNSGSIIRKSVNMKIMTLGRRALQVFLSTQKKEMSCQIFMVGTSAMWHFMVVMGNTSNWSFLIPNSARAYPFLVAYAGTPKRRSVLPCLWFFPSYINEFFSRLFYTNHDHGESLSES